MSEAQESQQTYAERVHDIYSDLEAKFDRPFARDISLVVRAANSTNPEFGSTVLHHVKTLIRTTEDQDELKKTIMDSVQSMADEAGLDSYRDTYLEFMGFNADARKFVEDVVPTLKSAEVGSQEGTVFIKYEHGRDFAQAIELLRPEMTLSASSANFLIGASIQLGFIDANDVIHVLAVSYTKESQRTTKVNPAIKKLDERGVVDCDGVIQVAPSGDIYIMHATDAPLDQERREKVVSDWMRDVQGILEKLSPDERTNVKFQHITDSSGTAIDLTVGKKHYVTVLADGDAYDFGEIAKALPDWIKPQSQESSLEWLKMLKVAK